MSVRWAFVRFRTTQSDWPAKSFTVAANGQRSACGTGNWKDASAAEVLIRVDQPLELRVSLGIHRSRRAKAVCTTEQADIHIELGGRHWSVLGTGHAEVGL